MLYIIRHGQTEQNHRKLLTGRRDYRLNATGIRQAQEALNRDRSIACTGCHYCTDGCPMQIPIPEIFNVENRKKGQPEFRTLREYAIVTIGKGKASREGWTVKEITED